MNPTQQQINELLDRLVDKSFDMFVSYDDVTKPFYPDVSIGRVLQLIEFELQFIEQSRELLFYWKQCGFTRSLNDIAKDNTKESNELINYLLEIGL